MHTLKTCEELTARRPRRVGRISGDNEYCIIILCNHFWCLVYGAIHIFGNSSNAILFRSPCAYYVIAIRRQRHACVCARFMCIDRFSTHAIKMQWPIGCVSKSITSQWLLCIYMSYVYHELFLYPYTRVSTVILGKYNIKIHVIIIYIYIYKTNLIFWFVIESSKRDVLLIFNNIRTKIFRIFFLFSHYKYRRAISSSELLKLLNHYTSSIWRKILLYYWLFLHSS